MAKKPIDPELLKQFDEARQVFLERYSARGTKAALYGKISATTVSRLIRPDKFPNDKFGPRIQKWLIKQVSAPTESGLYAQMAHQMAQKEGDKAILLDAYLGKYHYFQYWTRQGVESRKLVMGEIHVFADDGGNPAFRHWSHDYDKPKPEHEGFVFHYEAKLYFAGTRPGVMRLAIARTFAPEGRRESFLPGLIVSVRNEPYRDPYAARFILVHEDNRTLIDDLDPDKNSKAEARFAELLKSSGDDYMLLN